MPNWAPDFFSETWFQVVVALLVAVVVAGIEKLRKKTSWATVSIYFLVSLTCMTVLMDRYWQPSTKVRVRSWLDNTGFKITTKQEPAASFYFVAEDPAAINANVYQSKESSFLFFQVNIVLSNEEQGMIRALTPEQHALFIVRLRMHLLQFGVSYEGLTGALDRVVLQEVVSPDIAEVEFVRDLAFIRLAATLFRNATAMELMSFGVMKVPDGAR